MDSFLSESLIGVTPPPEDYSNSETASCLDKPSSSRLFTANRSKLYDQEAPAAISNLAKFRVAVLSIYAQYQFINGINHLDLDLDSHDEEQTETTEEANVPSRYYCYQCRQVVSVTVDVEITCPLCQGGRIQECGGVSLLYLSMPSESERSASNGNVTPGHTWSPFHSISSHDYDNYDEPHQETVYDSNLSQSLLLNIGSQSDTGINNVAGHVGLLPLSIDANIVTDRPHHAARVTRSVWIFSVTGFGFEAVSAFFDQVSTPRKPRYALYGMLLSVVAVLVCILDLIHNALKQREAASGSEMLWGILPEVFGLALACVQCISSALQFSFICRHAANPVKVSLVPFLFFFVLFAFKYRNGRN